MSYEYPEIFITGNLPEKWTKESLVAHGLVGWANCELGAKMPENFGKGMSLIATNVGVATPDGHSKLADDIIKNKSK